ncbi:MAG: autotransporter-associated beta strand repeat-containing protein, partial [Verrucomicrobia bacterium]|nr:autotransporter-associated beta strand repeat-containing protein [Verrucomicrobiota bacterium]
MTPVQLARSGFLALLFSTLSPAGAATLTWTGAGVNAGWATGGNWAEGAYANGNDLIFTGASRPVSYMVNASTVNSLTFSNGASAAFTVRLEANSGAARVLTFQAANTGITVQSAVTNVHTIGLTSGSITLLGDLTVSQNSTNNFSIIRPIDGSFGLIKNGVGPLILSGTNNTFTGGLTLNAGTVSLNHPSVLGGGTFTIAGGTIDNTSGNAISNINNNAQSWNADPVFTGTSDLNLGTGAVTLGANRLVTVAAGGLTVGGGISGAFTLTKAGAGSLTLGGANTYTGHTTVSNGTL